MGLDMYLTAKRYLSRYDEDAKTLSDAIKALLGPEVAALDVSVQEVMVRAAYWRKANAIHGWFVRNVQNGVDNCEEFDVERTVLIELRSLCQHALDARSAPGDLQPTPGFFFGSNTVDEGYFEDMQDTIKQIDVALQLPSDYYFTYRSSW